MVIALSRRILPADWEQRLGHAATCSIVNNVNKEILSSYIKQITGPADWEQRLGHAATCSIVIALTRRICHISSSLRGQLLGNRGSAMLQPAV
jgi:hypothetical protein